MEWLDGGGSIVIKDYHNNPENELFQKLMEKAPPLKHPLYYEAFQELSTERQIGMSIGPIPISKMWEWAFQNDLTSSEARAFVYVISRLDNAYMSLEAEKHKKSQRQ